MWMLLFACQDPGGGSSPGPRYVPPPDLDLLPEQVPSVDVPTVVVNEVMSDNESWMQRDDGSFSDWLELYNASDEAIGLERLAVWKKDDGWFGAEGSELLPGEHLVLYADEGEAPDSLPFNLDGEGDTLTVTVDGLTTDEVNTGPLPSDVAALRFPDGRDWHFGVRPTPGYTNQSAGMDTVDPRESLFQKDHVTILQITLSDEAYDGLLHDSREDVDATVMFEGIVFPARVHLKGSGSFQSITGKAAFKIDLNDIDPERRMRGVKKLTFNNGITWDPTWTHEWLTYSVFRAGGIAAPRVGWTRISVNGVDYGLYMNVETWDDELLERWYSDGDVGTLYEGYSDFTYWQNFHLEEGEPQDAWLEAVAGLVDGSPTAQDVAALSTYIDMDEFTQYMATEALTLQWDGYESPNNWRLYINAAGIGQWVPTGVDYTWSSDHGDPWYGHGKVYTACLSDPTCWTLYTEKIIEVADLVDGLHLVREFDDLTVFLADEIATDERTTHSPATIESAQIATRKLLERWPTEARESAEAALAAKE
jgi:hypothetical protein